MKLNPIYINNYDITNNVICYYEMEKSEQNSKD